MQRFLSTATAVPVAARVSATDPSSLYDVTELPFLPYAINNAGQIAGAVDLAGDPQPVFYNEGTLTHVEVAGAGYLAASNNYGQAVGTFWHPTHGFFVYDDRTGRVNYVNSPELGADYGFGDCCSPDPSGINDSGQIAGWAYSPGPEYEEPGFIYANGVVTVVEGILPNGINNSGQIAGVCFPPLAPYSTACLYHNGAVIATFVLPGGSGGSEAYAINDAGHVVGRSYVGSAWQAFFYGNAGIIGLGTLPGFDTTEPEALNNRDEVVGYVHAGSGSSLRYAAFLYRDGTMYDLNTLAGLPAETLDEAWSINDYGQILAGGGGGYFLLTPKCFTGPQTGQSAQTAGKVAQSRLGTMDPINGDTVRIIKPNDGRDDFNFETREFAGEGKTGGNIPVQGLVPTGKDIRWQMKVEYTTSGGRGPFGREKPYFLTTASEQEANMRVEAAGGRVQITATAVAGTIEACPVPIHGTVTGFYPSTADVVALAESLYDGPTKKLLAGIASHESRLKQFCTPGSNITEQYCGWDQPEIYGRPGPWPVESNDGGSHIGLMMVKTREFQMPAAWDWRANLTFGRQVFGKKMDLALFNESEIRKRRPGLGALTPEQRENMAVCLYGPKPGGENPLKQYYRAVCSGQVKHEGNQLLCDQGTWTWAVNRTGNAKCVWYANDVRKRAGGL